MCLFVESVKKRNSCNFMTKLIRNQAFSVYWLRVCDYSVQLSPINGTQCMLCNCWAPCFSEYMSFCWRSEGLRQTNVTRKKLPDIYFPYTTFLLLICDFLIVLLYEIIWFILHSIFQPPFPEKFFWPSRNWEQKLYLGLWAQVCIQPSVSLRADALVYLSRGLDRYNSPCVFILPCSIQDRAIKEHSGCHLDEFFFPASPWQVRICSLAEKIGLNRIPIFPWMSVLIRVLCCPHKAPKTQQCRQNAVQRFCKYNAAYLQNNYAQ